MNRSVSPLHLLVTVALIALAGWLGLSTANTLGACYALIAAALVCSRAVDPEPESVPLATRTRP